MNTYMCIHIDIDTYEANSSLVANASFGIGL